MRKQRDYTEATTRDLKRRPPLRPDTERGALLTYMPKPRTISLPEPVDAGTVNGRPAVEWESVLIGEARSRERRAELELFRGLLG